MVVCRFPPCGKHEYRTTLSWTWSQSGEHSRELPLSNPCLPSSPNTHLPLESWNCICSRLFISLLSNQKIKQNGDGGIGFPHSTSMCPLNIPGQTPHSPLPWLVLSCLCMVSLFPPIWGWAVHFPEWGDYEKCCVKIWQWWELIRCIFECSSTCWVVQVSNSISLSLLIERHVLVTLIISHKNVKCWCNFLTLVRIWCVPPDLNPSGSIVVILLIFIRGEGGGPVLIFSEVAIFCSESQSG